MKNVEGDVMVHSYTRDDLKDIFFSALDMFNDCLDSDINKDNLRIDFFIPENGIRVYELFCSSYFPKYPDEPYKNKGYFSEIGAQAFVSESCYGVLIREDIDFAFGEVLQMFLHEISHLYCTRNEVPGGHFFDKYCMGSGVEDGMVNAGYAIWREAIADIMADSILSGNAIFTLSMLKEEIHHLDQELSIENPDSKKAMSLILAYIMISAEVATTTNWTVAEKKIKNTVGFDEPIVYRILEMVFEQLHTSPFWTITPEFIIELGQMYLELLSMRAFTIRIKEMSKNE
jgi:hypothetical protein